MNARFRTKDEISELVRQASERIAAGEVKTLVLQDLKLSSPTFYRYTRKTHVKVYNAANSVATERAMSKESPTKRQASNCAVFVGSFDNCLEFLKDFKK